LHHVDTARSARVSRSEAVFRFTIHFPLRERPQ